MFVIPALGRLGQEDFKSRTSLESSLSPCFERKKPRKVPLVIVFAAKLEANSWATNDEPVEHVVPIVTCGLCTCITPLNPEAVVYIQPNCYIN